MSRTRAHAPKIARCGGNAAAEVIVPNTIHYNPGDQWILGISQPSRKRAATARRIRQRSNFRIAGIENRKKSRLYFVALVVPISALQNMNRRGDAANVDHELTFRQLGGLQRIELRE